MFFLDFMSFVFIKNFYWEDRKRIFILVINVFKKSGIGFKISKFNLKFKGFYLEVFYDYFLFFIL